MVEGVLHGLEERSQLRVLEFPVHEEIKLTKDVKDELVLVHLVCWFEVCNGDRHGNIAANL